MTIVKKVAELPATLNLNATLWSLFHLSWPLTPNGPGAVLRHPVLRIAIVLKTTSALQHLLGRVHDGIPAVVFLLEMDGVEGNRYILLARAEETTNPDDDRDVLSFMVHQHVHDFADLGIGFIVHALLIPVGDRPGIGWQARE